MTAGMSALVDRGVALEILSIGKRWQHWAVETSDPPKPVNRNPSDAIGTGSATTTRTTPIHIGWMNKNAK